MALKYASIDTPDAGSIEPDNICWGQYESTIIGDLPYINGYEGLLYITIDIMCYDSETHTFDWSNLSFRKPGYADNPLYVYPWDRADGDCYSCLSLYDANGNWNIKPNIYIGNENNPTIKDAGPLSLRGGAFGDINGKANTAALLAAYTAEDYKITITKGDYGEGLYNEGYSPAAACCWRYHTLGTNQGDWYLGAEGEMAMIATNFGQIQARLWEIATEYPDSCFSQLDGNYYWSSSEYGDEDAHIVSLDLDVTYNDSYDKQSGAVVVPLLMW